jgi:aspartyl/asparaginyl beta-hydroxylase (cupin superfamily)
MRLDSAIISLFEYPVADILAALPAPASPLWDMAPFRQNRYRAHEATRSIVFNWLPNAWRPGETPIPIRLTYPPTALSDAVWAFAGRLLQHRQGMVAKLMLAELAPGEKIRAHSDTSPALALAHRCHLPIVSSAGVRFLIEREPHLLRPGTCYEFDNTRLHAVRNDGDASRVHLICDILPEAACQTAA